MSNRVIASMSISPSFTYCRSRDQWEDIPDREEYAGIFGRRGD